MANQRFPRFSRWVFAALLLLTCGIAFAQDKSSSSPIQQPTTVLHASTQLVVVDVVVEDSNGNPIHGLMRDDFRIVEGKAPQSLRNFAESSSTAAPASHESAPVLPPGTFTDYVPVKPNAPLNVLLIDALNTPMLDQSRLRNQLLEYLKHADPTAQTAIFGLNRQLVFLQGFTSNPALLRIAIEHKAVPQGSKLLRDATGSNLDQNSLIEELSEMAGGSGGLSSSIAAIEEALVQFDAQSAAIETQLRLRYTLEAFQQIGRYLSVFPGRKNLIWFSGSFPLSILPDVKLKSAAQDAFGVMGSDEGLYRETTDLLAHAQVAVYPVDARGIMTQPMTDLASTGSQYAGSGPKFGDDAQAFLEGQFDTHQTMDQMAKDTGGRAFYNTNGLALATEKAIHDGSNYYSLTYSPTDHHWDGEYRPIHVEVNDPQDHHLKLYYRHGYYADDPDQPRHIAERATIAEAEKAAARSKAGYARAALTRGAPAPSEVIFKVHVSPARPDIESPATSHSAPITKPKEQQRSYTLDFAALARTVTWRQGADGHRLGSVEFEALIFDNEGKLLNSVTKPLQFDITPEVYATLLKQGIGVRLEITAPAKPETYMRIAVHDHTANRFGVVEIPLEPINQLTPLAENGSDGSTRIP